MGDGVQITQEQMGKYNAELADPKKADKWPDMPVDDGARFIAWHKSRFGADAIYAKQMRDELAGDQIGYSVEEYEELKPEAMQGLLDKAIAKVGGGVSLYRVKQVLAEMPLGELIVLANYEGPFILPEETEAITQKEREKRVDRVSAFSETQRIAKPDSANRRYVSALPLEESLLKQQFREGFGIKRDMGFTNNAIWLGNSEEDNLAVLTHPHHDRDAYLIMVFPNFPDEIDTRIKVLHKKTVRADPADLLWEKIEGAKPGEFGVIHDAVVPAKFIEGYLNLQTGKYERNMSFNPQYTEEDLQKIDKRLKVLEGQETHALKVEL